MLLMRYLYLGVIAQGDTVRALHWLLDNNSEQSTESLLESKEIPTLFRLKAQA